MDNCEGARVGGQLQQHRSSLGKLSRFDERRLFPEDHGSLRVRRQISGKGSTQSHAEPLTLPSAVESCCPHDAYAAIPNSVSEDDGELNDVPTSAISSLHPLSTLVVTRVAK